MLKSITISLVFLFVFYASAQNASEIDTTFNTEGWFGLSGSITKIAHRADGKILVSGDIDFYRNTPVQNIFCLNPDGTLDTSFNPGSTFSTSVSTFAIQPDGKIIVSGYSAGNDVFKRLNPDGSIDGSFSNTGSGFNYAPKCLAVQPDGKILAGGNFNFYNGAFVDQLLRFNSDGSLDTSLDADIETGADVMNIIVLSNGKIIVGGTLSNPGICIKRLNPNGTTDTPFSNVYLTSVNTLQKQSDGKIIFTGAFNIDGNYYTLGRINANGTLDTSFLSGVVNTSDISATAIQPDGKILVGGNFTTYNEIPANNIVRLNTDGTVDGTFQPGTGFDYHIYALETHTGNTFFAGGDFTHYGTTNADSIILVGANGNIDPSFGTGTTGNIDIPVSAIGQQTDGKILAAGYFNHYNNAAVSSLVRLNSDGGQDTTFNIGSGFKIISSLYGATTASIRSVIQQSDGKIIVGGTFNSFNGNAVVNLVRLHPDGSVDADFTNNNAANLTYNVNVVSIQPDGKILVAGSASNNWASDRIVRLHPDGTLDNSFSSSAIFNAGVEAVQLQPDGKIVVAGRFSRFNNQLASGIVRLNGDGMIDSTFISGSGFNSPYVNSLALQPDGKIIVGGFISSYNGNTTVRDILRLNHDGSLDTSFITGTGIYNGGVLSTALDSNGKVLIGGSFPSYNGTGSNNFIRLNGNGTVDNDFNVGTGFNKPVWETIIQPDGKIVVSGSFSSYNGTLAKQIIRLNGNSVLATIDHPFESKMACYPNPVKDVLQFTPDALTTAQSYTIYDCLAHEVKRAIGFSDKIDVRDLSNGVYILKIETNRGCLTQKFIKE